MIVNTVKVNCDIKRSMNAGLTADFDSYYRAEENKQIKLIVNNLILKTSNDDYTNGVIRVYDVIQKSDNTEHIKAKIFKEYCLAKARCCF